MTYQPPQPGADYWGGYGYEDEDARDVMAFDAAEGMNYAAADPRFYSANPAKDRDDQAWGKVVEAMRRDGFRDGSVSLRYLSHVGFGKVLTWPAQLIGSCVASGAMRALVYRMLAEIFIHRQPEQLLGRDLQGWENNIAPFAPYHYGCGRRRGNMRGGDGSYCSVQVQALKQDGILICAAPGLKEIVGTRPSDYPETQNERLYRQFGDWKYLDDLAPTGRKIRLMESERVRDVERAADAITKELKPLMICSDWGFARDRAGDGFSVYRKSGSWAHNMTLSGVRLDSSGRKFIEVTNSWGPRAHDDGEHFYVPFDLADRWLKDAEAATIGDIDLPDDLADWADAFSTW